MPTNTFSICVATMSGSNTDVDTWVEHAALKPSVHYWLNTPEQNLGVTKAYQKLYETTDSDVLLYLHQDVICREQDWDLRLMAEFIDDPQVAVAGFGGALWHGLPSLYKTPYQLQQLQRGDYMSNVDDAEVHGSRFEGSCNVAVLDGFALAVRRSFLDRIGGWTKFPTHSNYFNYDYILCALARRYKQKVRLVGVKCHHRGGSASVGVRAWFTSQEAYDQAHRWFYDNFSDVLPARVKP